MWRGRRNTLFGAIHDSSGCLRTRFLKLLSRRSFIAFIVLCAISAICYIVCIVRKADTKRGIGGIDTGIP